MSKFCTKCGGKIAEDSLFCEYCGNKVTTSALTQPHFIKGPQPSEKPIFSSYSQVSSVPSYTSSYRPSPRTSSNWAKWLFIGIFIVVIIGFVGVILVGLVFLPFGFNMFNQYEYIGDLTEYIGEDITNATSKINLEIDNSVGAVNIDIVDTSVLFDAEIHVYAHEGHDLHDANTFEIQEADDQYMVFFDSSSGSDWENPYYYDLDIILASNATIALDISVSTGSISLFAQQTNISSLYLDTSTGSITADFEEVYFSASQDITLHTSTGSITALLNDVSYSSSEVNWFIDTSTGSIDVDLFQEMVDNNTLINYNLDTSTGSIGFTYDLNSIIGLYIYADVSTGQIYAPGHSTDEEYTYESGNYTSTLMKFEVFMHTSTGSIYIEEI
ncbi:MAG: hypothetical protein ACFFFH_17810 [Candidatus Thorarchaeota archaeon]